MGSVWILTYHFSDNYGALLQAYALREWFRRRAIDAQLVNYQPQYVEKGGSFDQLWNPQKRKKNLVIAYLKLSSSIWKVFQSRDQREMFESFRHRELGIAGPKYLSINEIPCPKIGDLIICGSDQIWSPSVQRGLDPAYFLAFGLGTGARCISYAASFGRATLPAEFHARAGQLINGLDAISVREESGVDIVRQIAGREAVCVPDPTILLGDFRALLDTGFDRRSGHVFCYALRSAKTIREVALWLGQSRGVPVLSPRSARQRWRAIGTQVAPGPTDWLRLLNGANIVVTNSFHGVALSLVLNRPFIAVGLPGHKNALNERVAHLLSQVGLSDRVISEADSADVDKVAASPIDWVDVNAHLDKLRRSGERFIADQLAGVSTHVE